MSVESREDPRSVAELMADYQQGYSLDQRFYTDPDIYELELERVVYRNWILAGHVSEFREPGDFKVFKVARESAIIVRGKDGAIKGFANVCRHRGSLVCLESKGNTDRFSCPYHGWMYDLDGKLFAARSMPEDFDMTPYSLKPVSVDVIHGLVFVCFSDKPLSLEGPKRDLAEPMAMFDFENLKVIDTKSYDIPANWKLSVENYQECYHCATAHSEYAAMHTMMLEPGKRERVQERMRARWDICGIKGVVHDHNLADARPGEMGYGYSRTAMFEKYKTGSRDGQPVAPLLGNLKDYDGGASDFTFGGFSFLLAYSDHVVAYVFTPVDHHSSRCQIYWLVRNDAVEGKDYVVDDVTWLWHITTLSDKEIIVNNSKGVLTKYYEPGPLSKLERPEQRFIDWVLMELQRPL